MRIVMGDGLKGGRIKGVRLVTGIKREVKGETEGSCVSDGYWGDGVSEER